MELLTYNKVADQKRLAFIVNNVKRMIPNQGMILDVGCGNGIISTTLGQLGYRVKGIDVSEKAVQKAQRHNQLDNVVFEVADAEELVATHVTYDVIICSEVLEHLKNPSDLLQILHQLLKNTGILLVTVPNGLGPREVMVTRPTLKLRKDSSWLWKSLSDVKRILKYEGATVQSDADNLDHVQFFSKQAIYALSKRNDFTVERFESTNFIEDVFPFSLLTRRFVLLQKLDCWLADRLPHFFTSGFVMVWRKAQL